MAGWGEGGRIGRRRLRWLCGRRKRSGDGASGSRVTLEVGPEGGVRRTPSARGGVAGRRGRDVQRGGGGESGMGQGSVVAMCTGWLGLWPLDGGFLSAAAAAAASRPPSRDHSAAREGGHEHGDEAHEPRVWMRDLGPSGIAAVNN